MLTAYLTLAALQGILVTFEVLQIPDTFIDLL